MAESPNAQRPWVAWLILIGVAVLVYAMLTLATGNPAKAMIGTGRLLQIFGVSLAVFWLVVGIVRRLSRGKQTPPQDE